MSEFIERAVDFEPLPDEERVAGKDSAGDGRTLEGYAAVFDSDTEINSWEGHFKERITRGAFRKTLKERTPVLQFDHGHDSRFGNLPIGSFENIKEDRHGLRVQARLFDHAEPIRQAIEAGAVTGMSFRFKVVRDSWADDKGNPITDRNELMDKLYNAKKGDKPLQRTIKEVKLMEAGPVVFPAYPDTTVGVRSMTDDQRKRAIEDLTSGFDPMAVTEEDVERAEDEARNALLAVGVDEDQVDEILTVMRAFPPKKEGDEKKPSGGKAAPGHDAKKCEKCTPDAKTGKCPKCGATTKKTSSSGEKPKTEKKSEEGESEVPVVESDDTEPRSEAPDDAAQAGTSKGMSSNARERALRLLDI